MATPQNIVHINHGILINSKFILIYILIQFGPKEKFIVQPSFSSLNLSISFVFLDYNYIHYPFVIILSLWTSRTCMVSFYGFMLLKKWLNIPNFQKVREEVKIVHEKFLDVYLIYFLVTLIFQRFDRILIFGVYFMMINLYLYYRIKILINFGCTQVRQQKTLPVQLHTYFQDHL